ncbi:MAG: stage II sporulation protein M [Clostridia bacterium]|nr:stage II sporulation protein M [Clostridia bacterium]
MNSEKFLEIHRAAWERLDKILEQMGKKGAANLDRKDLLDLGPLFRQVTAHLAYAQANFPRHEVVHYLNRLVAKAHSHIYKSETMSLRRIWLFYRQGLPRLIWGHWRYVLAAAITLLGGLAAGFIIHYVQPALDGLVIPEQWQRMIGDGLKEGKVGADWPVNQRPLISTAIMINNILVGLKSFALGFTWGVGTVYILFYNGLLVGVLAGIFTQGGYALEFWSLILPHGVLELIAIFICGGAGLILAKALVKPGDYTRRDALVVNGRIAMKLILGTIPMFVLAALIEGFITPLGMISSYAKLAFAGFTLALFVWYIYQGVRGVRRGNI